jgi:TfoX/Sxy family transcriptional regulator of competence genes
MAKMYFNRLTEMLADIAPEISAPANLEIKHFFSGAAVYADGRICITFTPAGLALKLPKALREELLREEGTRQLQYFPNSPVKKDYVVLPERLRDDKGWLCFWVNQSIEYVLTLPRPEDK